MRISTMLYCVRQGLSNIRRNRWFALVSAASISACIFLFCLFFGIINNVRYMVHNAESQVGVTAFFDAGISRDDVDRLGSEILARPEVESADYISPDEAWEKFKSDYFAGSEELAEGFAQDNPLAESASYNIRLRAVEQQQSFVDWLKQQQGIRKVNYSVDAASTLVRFNRLVGLVSAAIIGILLAVSIFLISSTISTAAAFHREEYKIMRLIGATNSMIRAPFVVEGMVLGLIGTVVPLAAFSFLYRQAVHYMAAHYDMLSSIIGFLPLRSLLLPMSLVALALGEGVGFVGSFFTIRKHLKV